MGNAESVPEPTSDDKKYLEEAIKEARKGMFEGGIPVGAVLVVDGKVVGRGNNRRVQHGSPILHAEMMCLESAGRLPLGDYRRATLYTTLSPCAMCAGAVLHYQIPRVVIADREHFQGEEMLLMTRGVEVMSLDFPDAKVLVKEFIELHPDLWAEDSGTEVGSSSAPPPRLGSSTPQAALPAPAAERPPPIAYAPPAALEAAPEADFTPPADNASAYAPSYAASEAPENASAYAGSAYAPSARGTPELPYSVTPLPPNDDESLPPPSAPPSMYGDDASQAEGSLLSQPQQ